jgi:hypothetical protein
MNAKGAREMPIPGANETIDNLLFSIDLRIHSQGRPARSIALCNDLPPDELANRYVSLRISCISDSLPAPWNASFLPRSRN